MLQFRLESYDAGETRGHIKITKFFSIPQACFSAGPKYIRARPLASGSKQKISVRKASLLVPGVSAPFVNGNGEQAASDEVVVVSSEGEAEEERKP